MKIVGTDNFNRETVDEFLLCENVKNEYLAEKICDALNSEDSDWFFVIRPDDAPLYKWEP
jgi:hypothetical protein